MTNNPPLPGTREWKLRFYDSRSAYPEHEKLAARINEHDAIWDFLTYLGSTDVGLVRFQDGVPDLSGLPFSKRSELITGFFGVNREAFEEEMEDLHRTIQILKGPRDRIY